MSLDHRTFTKGPQTGQGTVKFVYGADRDWVVWLNEDDQPIASSERTDDVFRKAQLHARRLSALSFKKLNKAHISDVNDHISTCLVGALSPPVPIICETTSLMRLV